MSVDKPDGSAPPISAAARKFATPRSFALWNDHGGPGNAGQVNGYLVEYSVPAPGAFVLVSFGIGLLGLSRRRAM